MHWVHWNYAVLRHTLNKQAENDGTENSIPKLVISPESEKSFIELYHAQFDKKLAIIKKFYLHRTDFFDFLNTIIATKFFCACTLLIIIYTYELLNSVRGSVRSELGGSHGCPGRLWDRFLWQVYQNDSRYDALDEVYEYYRPVIKSVPKAPCWAAIWDPPNPLRSKPRTEFTYMTCM